MQVKLSCTTDLGDAYYDGDLCIDVQMLPSERSVESVANGSVIWKRGMRVLTETVQLQCVAEMDLTKEYWLCLEARCDEDSRKLSLGVEVAKQGPSVKSRRPTTCSMPEVVGILAPISFLSSSGDNINQHVLRRFDMPRLHLPATNDQDFDSAVDCLDLYIFEEMGESIARHIW